MKNIWRIVSTLLILILSSILIYIIFNKKKEYSTNIYYMDTYIYVKFYSNNINKARTALEEIETIYKAYHQLTNRYNHYDGIMNLHDIKNNTLASENITLDSKLYQILEYTKEWQTKYEKINVEIGNIIDVWKKYRDSGSGVPSIEELKEAANNNSLILLGNNTIVNNHSNLDLGSIAKGYATEKVGEYLESVGITEYLINAGGNVKAGLAYNKDYYKIGIQSPIQDADLITVVKGENISVVTSGGYERNYEYNGTIYHHIIDPETLMPSDNMKSVTVVTSDSALGDILSTTLFLMSVEEGLELIKDYDAEAIWYTNDNEIIRSENFSIYEQE